MPPLSPAARAPAGAARDGRPAYALARPVLLRRSAAANLVARGDHATTDRRAGLAAVLSLAHVCKAPSAAVSAMLSAVRASHLPAVTVANSLRGMALALCPGRPVRALLTP
jgi:hypothetical protein